MDIILLLKALILGVVEGLTEFLPISSTGHLILAGDLLNFNDDRGKLFEIVIQSGAILAVVWEYRERVIRTFSGLGRQPEANRLVLNLFIAFLPLAVLGLIFGKAIKASLFAPIPVATAFILGAFVILWAERRQHLRHPVRRGPLHRDRSADRQWRHAALRRRLEPTRRGRWRACRLQRARESSPREGCRVLEARQPLKRSSCYLRAP